MRKNCICLFVVLCAFLFPRVAQAQRLVPGQWDLSAGLAGWRQNGVVVDFDKVDFNHKMVCRAGMYGYRTAYDVAAHDKMEDQARYLLRSLDLYASWGMVWRVAGNRSRSLNLWLGVAGDIGARLRRPLSVLDPEYDYSHRELLDHEIYDDVDDDRIPAASFLLGVTPELSFEWFPAQRFSVSAFVRPHLQWCAVGSDYSGNGREDVFLPLVGLQVHYYLFIGR